MSLNPLYYIGIALVIVFTPQPYLIYFTEENALAVLIALTTTLILLTTTIRALLNRIACIEHPPAIKPEQLRDSYLKMADYHNTVIAILLPMSALALLALQANTESTKLIILCLQATLALGIVKLTRILVIHTNSFGRIMQIYSLVKQL